MVIGIDLGGTNIRIAQVRGTEIANKISVPSPATMQLDESIEYLKSVIAPLITNEIRGIGIGIPSVMDSKRGIVYNVTHIPSWVEVHLKAILENEFKIPIYINNDSNCFALGEKFFGEGKEFNSIVAITLGTGVGAGIVIDGKLYSGNNTGAGEIGCVKYLDSDYEHYCASHFFTDRYDMTGEEAARRAANNDPEALRIWETYGRHMGHLIQSVLYTYDPQAIILGGGISASFDLYSNSMYRSFGAFLYPKTIENLKIRISQMANIATLGAAMLVR